MTYTLDQIKEMKAVTAEELECVSVKFSGNVKEWLLANRTYGIGESPVSVTNSLCEWMGVEKSNLYAESAKNESVLDVILRLI